LGKVREAKIQELAKILGKERVSQSQADRIAYARDLWTYLPIGFGEGPVEYPPDAIAWPESAEEVARVLPWAGKNGVPVIPYNGGKDIK
jgi:FAD/FMN-containing dehydrogenase